VADAYDELILAEPTLLDYYAGDTFQSDGKVTDAKGTNHLTRAGSVTTGRPNILPGLSTGAAIGFITDGHATRSSASAMPAPEGGFSVEAWVKPNVAVTDAAQIIWGSQMGYVQCYGSNLYFVLKTTAATHSIGPVGFTPGNVYHLVGTWDGGANARLYVNGVLAAVKTIDVPASAVATFLTMGGWWNATSPLNGDVERAAFYFGALGADEVLEHFDLGSGSSPPPPPPPDSEGNEDDYDRLVKGEAQIVAYYPGDAHSGASVKDKVGANDLTLSGSYTLEKAPLLPAVPTGKAVGFTAVARATKLSASGLPASADGISIEAWVKLGTVISGTVQVIFGTSIAYLEAFGDGLYFVVKTTAATYSVGRISFVPGRVYHVVGTWDGDETATLWVNGVPKSLAISTPPAANPNLVTMGAWWNDTTPSTCDVQCAAIYEGALSIEKVRAHYRAGLPKGPVGGPTSLRVPRRLPERARRRPRLPMAPPATGYKGLIAAPMIPYDRPYRKNSPWNIPADDVTVHPRSAQIVANLLSIHGEPARISCGHSTMGLTNDFAHPLYFAQENDPLYTIVLNSYYNIAVGEKLRIPVLAKPALSSDGHICIVQPNGWAYEIWQASISGQTLNGSIGMKIRIDGTGFSSRATAAHFALLGGIIRPEEFIEGEINHALFCVVAAMSEAFDFGFGVTKDAEGSDYVYPAEAGDATMPGADLPVMGARLKLDYTDPEIAALDIPEYRKTFVRAFARYGAYIGDTGGPGFGFQFLSGATYTSFGYTDPLVDFAIANGIVPNDDGTLSFDLAPGVDWDGRLRVLVPPTPPT